MCLRGPTRPSAHRVEITDALDSVVLTALQKNPANRYPDICTMREDLECLLRGRIAGRLQTPGPRDDDGYPFANAMQNALADGFRRQLAQ